MKQARARFANPIHSGDESPNSDSRSSIDSTESADSPGALDGVSEDAFEEKEEEEEKKEKDVFEAPKTSSKGDGMRSSLLETS